jgi:hypothetical protein
VRALDDPVVLADVARIFRRARARRLNEEGPVAANPADEGTSACSLEPVASAGFPVSGLSGHTAGRRQPGHHSSP